MNNCRIGIVPPRKYRLMTKTLFSRRTEELSLCPESLKSRSSLQQPITNLCNNQSPVCATTYEVKVNSQKLTLMRPIFLRVPQAGGRDPNGQGHGPALIFLIASKVASQRSRDTLILLRYQFDNEALDLNPPRSQ